MKRIIFFLLLTVFIPSVADPVSLVDFDRLSNPVGIVDETMKKLRSPGKQKLRWLEELLAREIARQKGYEIWRINNIQLNCTENLM